MSFGGGWGGAVASALENAGTAPVIANQVPAPGTAITRTQSIQFDVTDPDNSLRRVIVAVTQADTGVEEIVHDGDAFRGYYVNTSLRTSIAGGFRFNVLRAGGWTGAPTFQVYAHDVTGFENV